MQVHYMHSSSQLFTVCPLPAVRHDSTPVVLNSSSTPVAWNRRQFPTDKNVAGVSVNFKTGRHVADTIVLQKLLPVAHLTYARNFRLRLHAASTASAAKLTSYREEPAVHTEP